MKLLLDENLPVKLKYRFADRGFEVSTTKDMPWLGKQNGELLQLMLQHNFTTLITIDNNHSYQQNFKNYPIQVISLVSFDNTYATIMDFFDAVMIRLTKILLASKSLSIQTTKYSCSINHRGFFPQILSLAL